jgi:alkylated DNA repair dioxygenase AlkB
MYDKKVVEPRLTATWKHLHIAVIDDMRAALSARYGVDFDRGGLNFYRDGRDSVAWHRDRIPKEVPDPIVAIVTLGEGRDFLGRPYGGGKSVKFTPQCGDLLVTGGTMQRSWEHTVPKRTSAGPRMSITFRHGFDDPDERL